MSTSPACTEFTLNSRWTVYYHIKAKEFSQESVLRSKDNSTATKGALGQESMRFLREVFRSTGPPNECEGVLAHKPVDLESIIYYPYIFIKPRRTAP